MYNMFEQLIMLLASVLGTISLLLGLIFASFQPRIMIKYLGFKGKAHQAKEDKLIHFND